MADNEETVPIGVVTWRQIIMVVSIVIAIAGATWQASEFTHGITDRLAKVEDRLRDIDEKLDRWHSNEHAEIDQPEMRQ